MKRRLILLAVVVALLAGFGALLHSPPSLVDAISGATPKAKKAEQASAQLSGDYVFCINAAELPDSGFRTELKDMISGEGQSVSAPSEKLKLYVSDTDYALIRYAEKVCQTLRESGLDIQVKECSATMLRSRAVSGQYRLLLFSADLMDAESVADAMQHRSSSGGCIASAFSLTPAESMSRICAISAVKRRSALLLPRATPASRS